MDLDSRSLAYVDCYAQRFPAPGSINYHLSSTPTPFPLPGANTFTIEVREGQGEPEGKQHDVTVRVADGKLVADPPDVTIQQGDVVLWNAPDASSFRFTVQGGDEKFSFSSASLSAECLFSHVFLTPGVVKWIDANGTPVGGTIRVKEVDSSDAERSRQWVAALEAPSIITVEAETATPDALEVMAGQTVFWAISRASGITVTDERMVLPVEQPSDANPES
jgi:plastocyanin